MQIRQIGNHFSFPHGVNNFLENIWVATSELQKWNNTQVLRSGLFVIFLGRFKWPFQGLSDLHLGDQKVTWKKLDQDFPYTFSGTIRHKLYLYRSKYWWVSRVWRLDSGPNGPKFFFSCIWFKTTGEKMEAWNGRLTVEVQTLRSGWSFFLPETLVEFLYQPQKS